MSSEQSDEKTEICPTKAQELSDYIDSKLANAHGPFYWDIRVKSAIEDKDVESKLREDYFQRIVDRQEYFPELLLIYYLMEAFQNVIDDDLPSGVENLHTAEKVLADIKQKATLKNVENVLQHIFIETKCHTLKTLGQLAEAAELLKEIFDYDDMNKTELATLDGCHCQAVWLVFTDDNNTERTMLASTAIKYEPDNGKWHFLLAENYRDERRKQFALLQLPSQKETSACEEAYRLSPNVLFGVTLAQLYRESRDSIRATQVYKEVYALQPTSCTIRLQLALGFVRVRENALAKDCLDSVAGKVPEACRYTHYMAIYEEKCNRDFKAALPYYKSTTEKFNYPAEVQYIECRKTVEPDWDPLPYLLDLSEKYKNFPRHVTQPIYIRIGMYYLFEINDVLSACQYLTKAIEIEPRTKQLSDHILLFTKCNRVNIYHALAKAAEYALKIGVAMYDEEQIKALKKALQLCHENCRDLPSPYESSRTQAPRSQSSNSDRNYGRGSSARVETNWREEKSGTSSRGFPTYNPSRISVDALMSPKKSYGASHDRNFTSWRSDGQATRSDQSSRQSSSTFYGKEHSASTDRVRGRGDRRTAFSKPSDKNDSSEAGASCVLVQNF